jgi:hypothetical protein
MLANVRLISSALLCINDNLTIPQSQYRGQNARLGRMSHLCRLPSQVRHTVAGEGTGAQGSQIP